MNAPDGDLGSIRETSMTCMLDLLALRNGVSDGLVEGLDEKYLRKFKPQGTDFPCNDQTLDGRLSGIRNKKETVSS